MTSDRIREAAIYFFAQHGYEGTSLSQIAAQVGIKTPSLYAHFKSKEEIFTACLSYAMTDDMYFFQQQLQKNKDHSVSDVLYKLLLNYEERLRENAASMFCLRSLYFPPYDFKDELIQKCNRRVAELGELLYPLFEKAKTGGELQEINIEDAIEAYLCLFDGLVIELLYSGMERFQYRLGASWRIFSLGVFKQPNRVG